MFIHRELVNSKKNNSNFKLYTILNIFDELIKLKSSSAYYLFQRGHHILFIFDF